MFFYINYDIITIGDSMKKINLNKKSIIVILIAITIVIAIVTTVILFTKKEKNIEIVELNYINVLSKDDESTAAKLIKENIVRITNQIDDTTNIIGTGFFIKEGYLITNSHIVDIEGNITIEYVDGSTSDAYLYANSIDYDVAILKVPSIKVKALQLGLSNKKEVTNEVLAAGYIYNFKGEASVSKGIISAKRNYNGISYIQSDLAIDTGSSGGPLFDAKGYVIGINTFVTENRTFSLSLSSESVSMIIDALLENPEIEYLEDNRPSNNINSILVEVGYTENEALELYNDKEKITKSKRYKNNKKEPEVNESKNKENTVNNTTPKKIYYCDPEYNLVGKKCVRQTTYPATNDYGKCKEGYVQEGQDCTKKTIVAAKAIYPCDGVLTESNTCIDKVLEVSGESKQERWGSCPTGKTCYDLGPDRATNTTNKKFVSELVCPNKATKLSGNINYIWNGEELTKENIKRWNSVAPGADIAYDPDGTVYYTDTSNVLYMCAKEYDNETGVYTLYTYDDLKNTACPNGGTFKANTKNQGFYCLLSTSIHMYAWDPVCHDSAYSWIKDGNTYYCGRYIDWEHYVYPNYTCEEGNSISEKECEITDYYRLEDNYVCNENDIQNWNICITNEIVDAKIRTQ